MPAYLTAYGGSILGPIAKVLGIIMNAIFVAMNKLFGTQSIALTIIVFTVVIYMILFPLTYQQQKFSKLQQKIQPELKKIQDKYKNKKDQASMMAQQEEQQALYDKYGISMTGSCVQLLIQMPILFALYRVFYNVPAYITSVKDVFSGLVDGIMATNGFADTMQSVYEAANIRSVQVDFATTDTTAMGNYIVDVLYKLGDAGWDSLTTYFPNLTDTITSTQQALRNMNYLFGVNISDTPLNLIRTGFANGAWAVVIVALLFPAMSYLFQFLSMKLMPTASNGGDDAAAQQMRTMNTMMPLMSLVIGFTVPVGLVLYWIMGSVIRVIQQYFLNRHFDKMDLSKIIEKNKEKAAKKAEKRGERNAQIYSAATTNTRSNSMASKAKVNDSKTEALNKAADARGKAGKNSISAKANRVKDYNDKNSKK